MKTSQSVRVSAFVLVSCLAASGTWAGDKNFVSNGGFEDVDEKGWAVGWKAWPPIMPPGASVEIDDGVAHSGKRSLRLRHRDASPYTRAEQVVPMTNQRSYLVRFWFRAENLQRIPTGAGPRLYIGRDGSLDRAFRAYYLGYVDGKEIRNLEWRQFEIGPFNVGEQFSLAFAPYLHKTAGTVWFDDIEMIEAGPEILKRYAQQIPRGILRHDLEIIDKAAGKAGSKDVLAEVAQMRERVKAADLPTNFQRRSGTPFFPLQGDVYKLMAKVLAGRYPGQDLLVGLGEPFATQGPLAYPFPTGDGKLDAVRSDAEQIVVNLANTSQEDITAVLALSGDVARWPHVWRAVVPVEVHGGRTTNDALPLAKTKDGAAVVNVPSGMTRQVWLQYTTPNSPGAFAGNIRATWKGGDETLGFTVRVHDLVFPERWPIYTFTYAYIAHLRGDRPSMIKTNARVQWAAKDLAAHHMNAMYFGRSLPVVPAFDEKGNLVEGKLDWSRWDAIPKLTPATRMYLFYPALEVFFNDVPGRGKIAFGSAEWEELTVQFVRMVVRGLKARGIGYDRMLWLFRDEPWADRHVDLVLRCGRAVKKADPKLRIYSNCHGRTGAENIRRMGEVVDVWAPAGMDEKLVGACRETSEELWTYHVISNGLAPEFARGGFWHLFAEGVTGCSAFAYVRAHYSPWDPYDRGGGDCSFLYDGDKRELTPSKRWEGWREGIEDYTLLWMLREKARRSKSTPRIEEFLARCGKINGKSTSATVRTMRSALLRELSGN